LYEAAWRVGRLERVYSLQVVSLVKGFRKWPTVAFDTSAPPVRSVTSVVQAQGCAAAFFE
jgi:hypothetical protein